MIRFVLSKEQNIYKKKQRVKLVADAGGVARDENENGFFFNRFGPNNP